MRCQQRVEDFPEEENIKIEAKNWKWEQIKATTVLLTESSHFSSQRDFGLLQQVRVFLIPLMVKRIL